MIVYHAVMRVRGTAERAVLQVRWGGEVSPNGIQELCNAVIGTAQGDPLEVEITLAGEGKESLARELAGRLARLAEQGIAVRVR